MEQPSCPSVSIPCHDEHRDKKKRYTVYKVLVSVGRDEWFVFRRYAEFDKLYNTVRKQFPSMNLKIPAKRIFGDNFDPEFLKQRKTGLNEFIQKIVSHPQLSSCPEVRSFLLMDRLKRWSDASEDEEEKNSPTSRNINLGPSGNPHAKPTDFDFLKVIGKGSFGKVFLAKHRLDGKYYAIKVLQKRLIVHRREQKHIMAERSVLLKSVKHPFLVGLHYSLQTADKLYFVLDFINGGEVSAGDPVAGKPRVTQCAMSLPLAAAPRSCRTLEASLPLCPASSFHAPSLQWQFQTISTGGARLGPVVLLGGADTFDLYALQVLLTLDCKD